MFALRRSDVEHLNELARAAMDVDGRLGSVELEVAGQVFAVSDEVITLRNDRQVGVLNGMRATVTRVHAAPNIHY